MKYTLDEAREIAFREGWNRKLGYSKKELGYHTPRNPQNRNSQRRKARQLAKRSK